MDGDGHQNPAVAVVGIVGGVSVVVVVIFAVFVRSQMSIAAWIVSALVLMGVIVAPLVGRRN